MYFLSKSGVIQGLLLFRKLKKLCILHTYNTWLLHLHHPYVILSILKRESPFFRIMNRTKPKQGHLLVFAILQAYAHRGRLKGQSREMVLFG